MAKVCLDCGTPKLGRRCGACDAVTMTIYGEEREPICARCLYSNADGTCAWATVEQRAYWQASPVKRFSHRALDFGYEKAARYIYRCPDEKFRQNHHKSSEPSRNPLSPQQVQRIRLFSEVPSAFWLDPRYDDRDARRADYWSLPMSLKGMFGLAAITLASAAIAIAVPKKA